MYNMFGDNKFLVGLGIGFSAILCIHTLSHYRRLAQLRRLQERKSDAILAQRLLLDEFIEKQGQPPIDVQEQIARMGALEVVNAIKEGKFTAVQVMVTMCLRARKCAELYNNCAEEMFMHGIKEAIKADEKMKKLGPEKCGLLHGLPISVKEQIYLKGTDATTGIRSRCFQPSTYTCPLIDALIEQGAIPFVKSNVPLLLMIPESANLIYGRAKNPWDTERTPGGSSGGEAGLISSFSSFLGIGSDIGGSIRGPSNFCGLVGFKGTPERISYSGIAGPGKGKARGQRVINPVAGPIARCVEDAEVVLKIWLSKNSAMYRRDQGMCPLYYNPKNVDSKPKRIGYYYNDGWFGVTKGMKRAVDEAKRALEVEGHTVVPFTIPDPYDFVKCFFGILAADGKMRTMKSGLDGEILLQEYKKLDRISKIPNMLRPIIAFVLRKLGEKRRAFLAEIAGEKTVQEYWSHCGFVYLYRQKFLDAMEAANIDAILCPGGPFPAIHHGTSQDLAVAQSLHYLANVLHFPAGTVPITNLKSNECELEDIYDDSISKVAKGVLKNAEGLPVGIQIITKPWQDELCLKLMKDCEKNHAKYNTVKQTMPFFEL